MALVQSTLCSVGGLLIMSHLSRFENEDGDNDRYLDGVDTDENGIYLPPDSDLDSADDGSDYDIGTSLSFTS